jgi:hypothetical protein
MSEQHPLEPIRWGSSDYEPRRYAFHHPLTGGEVEYSPTDAPEVKLRLITQSHTIESDFQRKIFLALFDDSLEPEPFRRESVGHPEEAELLGDEKQVWRELLRCIGWKSVRKGSKNSKDVPELLVGFDDNPSSLISMLNDLECVKIMSGIAQTLPYSNFIEPSLRQELDIPQRTLLDHANLCALWTGRTNLRLAIKNPALYLRRIEQDMQEFSHQYALQCGSEKQFSITPTPETIDAIDRLLEGKYIPEAQNTPEFRRALAIGLEYQKYLTIYAMLHDVESPGMKDVEMKTKARVTGQGSATINEDALLIENVDHEYIQFHLSGIIRKHKLDSDLLRTIIICLASESSPTLAGYLLKDKRKGFSKRPDCNHIPEGQSVDGDQESGTVTNAEDMVRKYLPGGFHHIGKHDVNPVGSFEERMRLMAYMAATGISQEQLRTALNEIGLNPDLVFITSEEFSIAPNIVLREYHGVHKDGTPVTDILPVALVPGDVKRFALMFNFLHMWYYVSEHRIPMELATQDAFAFIFGDDPKQERLFAHRTDQQVALTLKSISPALPWFHAEPEFNNEARVISENELLHHYIDTEGNINNNLIIRVNEYPEIVFEKPGTLTVDDRGNILPYLQVIQQKRSLRLSGNTTIHPQSLPARLANVQKARKGPWYYVIPMGPEKQHELAAQLEGENDPMRRMLHLWTEPIDVDGKILVPTIRKTLGV